jgi:hypothetical protein
MSVENIFQTSFSAMCDTLKTEYDKQLKIQMDILPKELLKLLYTPNYGQIKVNVMRTWVVSSYSNHNYIHPHKDTYPVVKFSFVKYTDQQKNLIHQDVVIDNYGNMYTVNGSYLRGMSIVAFAPFQAEFPLPNQLIDLLKNTLCCSSFTHDISIEAIVDSHYYINPSLLHLLAKKYYEMASGHLCHSLTATVINSQTQNITILNSQIEQLQQENKTFEKKVKDLENWQCVVCQNRQKEIVYLPCCHLVCCEYCSIQLNKCSICNGQVAGRIKFFNC